MLKYSWTWMDSMNRENEAFLTFDPENPTPPPEEGHACDIDEFKNGLDNHYGDKRTSETYAIYTAFGKWKNVTFGEMYAELENHE